MPFFRPEAVVYAGMPALARLIGKETLGTFHERQGDQSLLTKNGPLPIGWGRAFGERTEYRRGGALSPEFDGHLWGFQAGFDLAAVETWAGRDHFGAFVGHTEANGDVRGFSLGQRRAASGSVDLGCDQPRPLLDPHRPFGLVSRQRADAFVARRLAALEPRRRDRARRQQHDGLPRRRLSVRSRAQASRSNRKRRSSGRPSISTRPATSFRRSASMPTTRSIGRIGARLLGTYVVGETTLRPYLKANLWRNFGATDRTSFGSVVLPASFGATSLEVGGGVVATVSQNVSLFATADYTTNLNGPHGETIEGNLGVRVTW